MGMRRIYNCDICRDEIKDPRNSFGVCFSNMTDFTLGGYGSTDGVHICYRCARQLREHLNNKQICEIIYDETEGPEVGELRDKCENALKEAISAIYFADSSDYSSYLWQVLRAIDDEAAQLLEDDAAEAYRKYVHDEDALIESS